MAEQVLAEHREGMVQLAELLLEREVVFTEDVERIFGRRKKDIEREKEQAASQSTAEQSTVIAEPTTEPTTEQPNTEAAQSGATAEVQ